MNTKIKRKSALNYFGGKSRFLDWLLPLFPEHFGYLESFVGGGVVFYNKQPSKIEVINDIDNRLYNFMSVLRDNPQELIRKLELTTYSRAEFQHALPKSPDPIEDARRYFVRSQQSFGGQSVGTRRQNSWRTSMTESRNGMSIDVSKWLNKIDGLIEVIDRLKVATIENRPFDYVKPKFVGPNWFHFDDPPYLTNRTGKNDYEYEMGFDDHLRLAKINNEINAMVMICTYENKYYDEWYPEPKWKKILGPDHATNLGKTKKPGKREMVYINYTPPGASYNMFENAV